MKKRFSLLLALIMIVTLIPATGFAAEGDVVVLRDCDLGFHHGTSPNGGQSVTKGIGYAKKTQETFQQTDDPEIWLLVYPVDEVTGEYLYVYECPVCGRTDWVSYSNMSTVFDGANIQVAHYFGAQPLPGSLEVNVNITRQNHIQDWRNYSEQDWRNYSEQEWRNYIEQDWRNYSEQEWRNYTEQDWRNFTEQDWRNYREQDWREYTEQDWRNYVEQDWRKYTEQDWRNYTEQDWRNYIEQDWRYYTEQDWRYYTEQDWREVFKQDWRNIVVPSFEKKISSVNGTLVTWLNNGNVPGGKFGNYMTWMKVDYAAAKEGITYTIADSSPSNKPIEYTYSIKIGADGKLHLTCDDRLISAAVTAKLYSEAPTKHDPSGHKNLTNGAELVVDLPLTGAKATATATKSGDDVTVKVGSASAIVKYVKNGSVIVDVGGYKVKVDFNGNGVKSATVTEAPAVTAPASGSFYMFVHFESLKWYTTGKYEFVKWEIDGKENVGVPYKTGEENVGPVRTGRENVGDARTGRENVGDPKISAENVGPLRSGTEDVGEARTGTENVGAARTGVENVGSPRTGTENVGDARTGRENVGDARTGVENVGSPRTGTEDVGSPKTGKENVGPPRISTEDVGSPRKGTEDVGDPRIGTENVGSPRNDGSPVAYTGALTLSINGPSLNENITVIGGRYNNVFNNITPGEYVVTLSGAGFTTMSQTVTVPPAGRGTASFTAVVAGATTLNRLSDRIGGTQLPDRNERIQIADKIVENQLADRNDRIKLDDRIGGTQFDDRIGGTKLADRIGGTKLDDRIGGTKLDDRIGGTQLADRNDRFQLADRNDRIELTARIGGTKLDDRIGGTQLADRNDSKQLTARIEIGNQLADRKKCEDCNEIDWNHEHAKLKN